MLFILKWNSIDVHIMKYLFPLSVVFSTMHNFQFRITVNLADSVKKDQHSICYNCFLVDNASHFLIYYHDNIIYVFSIVHELISSSIS